METTWVYRLFILIPAELAARANGLWTTLFGEDADVLTFGVPLSADGLEPASYYGCNTAATLGMKARIDDHITATELPGLAYYRVERNESILLEQVNGAGTLGQPWAWNDALDNLGLQTVERGIN